MSAYFAAHAWLPAGLAHEVRITVTNGRFEQVVAGAPRQSEDVHLPGLVLPGFANTHSHAFHRALRGRTHDQGGTFWTWRERMYAVAARLDPDSYLQLARATYVEMALAGITTVGEFHYLHHGPGGQRYADPNAMGQALIQAAAEAGIRITLLDTCYLAGGLDGSGHQALDERQLRFSDGSAAAWADRVEQLAQFWRITSVSAGNPPKAEPGVRIGAAIHSVRAVPRADIALVVAESGDRPLHIHLSEQPAENDQCLAAYGVTPTCLLADLGALSPRTTAVHATHLRPADIAMLGTSGTAISMCPTTERDLADGIGPARELADAGSPITLGSDQNAVVDLLAEAQALELDERLASLQRGRFQLAELVDALTVNGHRSLGWADAGSIAVGQRADLVAVRLDTARTAGVDPVQAVMVAGSTDIDTVIVDGRVIVAAGVHVLGAAGPLLAGALDPLWTADDSAGAGAG